jgi:hypothetical protein
MEIYETAFREITGLRVMKDRPKRGRGQENEPQARRPTDTAQHARALLTNHVSKGKEKTD